MIHRYLTEYFDEERKYYKNSFVSYHNLFLIQYERGIGRGYGYPVEFFGLSSRNAEKSFDHC